MAMPWKASNADGEETPEYISIGCRFNAFNSSSNTWAQFKRGKNFLGFITRTASTRIIKIEAAEKYVNCTSYLEFHTEMQEDESYLCVGVMELVCSITIWKSWCLRKICSNGFVNKTTIYVGVLMLKLALIFSYCCK